MSYKFEISWIEGVTEDQRKEVEDFLLQVKNEIDTKADDFMPKGIQSIKITREEDAAQA